MTNPKTSNDRSQIDRRDVNLMSTTDVARIIGVNPKTMVRLARRGVVPAFAVGRVLKFDLDEVLDALRTRAA